VLVTDEDEAREGREERVESIDSVACSIDICFLANVLRIITRDSNKGQSQLDEDS
jgi:hypothetical protein